MRIRRRSTRPTTPRFWHRTSSASGSSSGPKSFRRPGSCVSPALLLPPPQSLATWPKSPSPCSNAANKGSLQSSSRLVVRPLAAWIATFFGALGAAAVMMRASGGSSRNLFFPIGIVQFACFFFHDHLYGTYLPTRGGLRGGWYFLTGRCLQSSPTKRALECAGAWRIATRADYVVMHHTHALHPRTPARMSLPPLAHVYEFFSKFFCLYPGGVGAAIRPYARAPAPSEPEECIWHRLRELPRHARPQNKAVPSGKMS